MPVNFALAASETLASDRPLFEACAPLPKCGLHRLRPLPQVDAPQPSWACEEPFLWSRPTTDSAYFKTLIRRTAAFGS